MEQVQASGRHGGGGGEVDCGDTGSGGRGGASARAPARANRDRGGGDHARGGRPAAIPAAAAAAAAATTAAAAAAAGAILPPTFHSLSPFWRFLTHFRSVPVPAACPTAATTSVGGGVDAARLHRGVAVGRSAAVRRGGRGHPVGARDAAATPRGLVNDNRHTFSSQTCAEIVIHSPWEPFTEHCDIVAAGHGDWGAAAPAPLPVMLYPDPSAADGSGSAAAVISPETPGFLIENTIRVWFCP